MEERIEIISSGKSPTSWPRFSGAMSEHSNRWRHIGHLAQHAPSSILAAQALQVKCSQLNFVGCRAPPLSNLVRQIWHDCRSSISSLSTIIFLLSSSVESPFLIGVLVVVAFPDSPCSSMYSLHTLGLCFFNFISSREISPSSRPMTFVNFCRLDLFFQI